MFLRNRAFFILSLSIGVVLTLFIGVSAQQQEGERKIVTDVRIENNKIISTQTILSKIKTKPNTVFTQEFINEDLKRLYSTDYFSDVSVDIEEFKDGIAVTFIVTEKPEW